MKILKKQIEEHGLDVRIMDKRYMWVKAHNTSIKFDAYELFGLEDDDLILSIKQKFYQYNVKIDILNPEKNKSNKKSKPKNNTTYESVHDKKKKIRNLLKNKFKLIP